jgi:phospholipid transport system substrate-binding protein
MLRTTRLIVALISALVLPLAPAGASELASVSAAVAGSAPAAVAPSSVLGSTPAAPGSTVGAQIQDEVGCAQVVENLHAAILDSMKRADELGFAGRYDRLEPVVDDTFDLEFMSSKSVGRLWKKLSPEDQVLWRNKFRDYLTANYAGNFNVYTGETFETTGEEPAARDTRMVLTRLNVPDDEDVILNYRMIQTDGRWRIIDIYLKGTVSELALRRSDFSVTLKRDGFDELAAAVDRKIAELREKGGG